jgi:adenine-specific DNA glycosylase
MSVRSDPKSLLFHKSTPNRTHIKRTQSFSTKPPKKGREKPRTLNFRNSSKGAKLKLRSDQNLWAELVALPQIKLEEHKHSQSTKSLLILV